MKYICIYTNLSAWVRCDTRSNSKCSFTGLNSFFSSLRLVAIPRLNSPVFPTILPIDGGRIVGFILFPRVLTLYEMQTATSRIWTRVAISISCDVNHHNTNICIDFAETLHSVFYIYLFAFTLRSVPHASCWDSALADVFARGAWSCALTAFVLVSAGCVQLEELFTNSNLARNNTLSNSTKSLKARYRTCCQHLR